MLRHALRRLLWIIPILIGVTLVSFALLSYVPDPYDDPRLAATLGDHAVLELRRSRFLDLPRFFNERPVDLAVTVDEALARMTAGTMRDGEARALFARLGGAVLPYLLPRLDALEPRARARLAAALSPIALRMGLDAPEASNPATAVTFWSHLWDDRSRDFRPEVAARAARLFADHGTLARRDDLIELDTFALDAVVEEMARARTKGDPAAMGRLAEVAARVTGRPEEMIRGASAEESGAVVRRWEEWWLIHRADYVRYAGPERLGAMLSDTQYARWTVRTLSFGLGAGGPVEGSELRSRARVTVGIVTMALFLAYGLAIVLGTFEALRHRRRAEVAPFAATLLAYAVPLPCVAVVVHALVPGESYRLSGAVIALACALLAAPARHQRAALLDHLVADHVRTARAFGLGPLRIALRGMRSAGLPLVALLSVEAPVALGGAFVVEKAFSLPGLGQATLLAVETHDVAWLVAIAFWSALGAALVSLVSDLAVAALDPRLASAALRHQRMFV